MNYYIILGLVFISIFLIIYLILQFIRRITDPKIKRVKEMDAALHPSAQTVNHGEGYEKKKISETVEKVLSDIGGLTTRSEEKSSNTRKQLIYAGYYKENSVKIYSGLKILSTLIFFVITLYACMLLDRSMKIVLVISSLLALIGYLIPDMILNGLVGLRQGKIAESLSDAIDLLVISVEAGLGLNAAIMRVGEDLHMRCPPLAEEFRKVNQNIRTGVTREDALRSLTQRNDVEDLKILVSALILADQLGTGIGDTLRAQADSLRTRIRQKAEEHAAKAGIKMLLPLVFFILPALIIIVMGPGLILAYRTLSQ